MSVASILGKRSVTLEFHPLKGETRSNRARAPIVIHSRLALHLALNNRWRFNHGSRGLSPSTFLRMIGDDLEGETLSSRARIPLVIQPRLKRTLALHPAPNDRWCIGGRDSVEPCANHPKRWS